jgi:hypothetical protein
MFCDGSLFEALFPRATLLLTFAIGVGVGIAARGP